MGQIFISHAARDKESVELFSKVFSPTKVKAVFEEFEAIMGKHVNSEKINKDIENSNAVFILLDKQIENLKHTRDWIAWECGNATAMNKDVWIFEKIQDFGSVSIITPSLTHFVTYTNDNNWYGYLRTIVETYDDSHVLGTAMITSGAGAVISEDKLAGALLGFGAGLILSSLKSTPEAPKFSCPQCKSNYKIHIPAGVKFRCPVCNSNYQMPAPNAHYGM